MGAVVAALALAACSPPKPKLFIGDTGYLLRIPAGYDVAASFNDAAHRSEEVVVFPLGARPQDRDALLAAGRAVLLEVNPIDQPSGRVGLSDLKGVIPLQLKKNGETFEITGISLALPAFIVRVTKPQPLVQIAAEGRTMTYLFTSGAEEPLLDALAGSLAEPARDVGGSGRKS